MPTPPRTSRDQIITAGYTLLNELGLSAVTMQAVATRVGVRAPSLYKHVADLPALRALVADAAARDLATHLAGLDQLSDMAHALRTWALAHPHAFRLTFSGVGSPETMATASASLLRASASIAGNADALNAARLLTAWATGFITMELAGAFQLGGDVDAAFRYGIDRITAALTTRNPPPASTTGTPGPSH